LIITERAEVGWGFWLWWVLASSVGLTVGFIVGFAVLDVEVMSFTIGLAAGGAVVGASVGTAQWLAAARLPRGLVGVGQHRGPSVRLSIGICRD
jgi:hypothetical protein